MNKKILIVSENPFGKSSWSNQAFNLLEGFLSKMDLELYYFCLDIALPFQQKYSDYAPLPFHSLYTLQDYWKDIRFYFIQEKFNFWKKIYLISNLNKIDKIIIIGDLSEFDPYNCGRISAEKYLYLPVKDGFDNHNLETFPNGNPNRRILSQLPIFDKIATPYQFGHTIIHNRYDYSVSVIPPIIEKSSKSITSKKEIREKLGIPGDCFLCLLIANNKEIDNKAIDLQLQAFSKFAKKHKDVYLYLHTNLQGPIDLQSLIKKLDIDKRIFFTKLDNSVDILSREAIYRFYQMSDVVLQASKSEGWGLTIIESQLHGTPVITTKSTCMEEITHLGIVTNPDKIISNIENTTTWSLPNQDNIVEALTSIKSNLVLNKNHISLEQYSLENISPLWKSFLDL